MTATRPTIRGRRDAKLVSVVESDRTGHGGVDRWTIESIFLGECSVERREGDPGRPGEIELHQSVTSRYNDGRAIYVAEFKADFQSAGNEPIAEMAVSYVAVYETHQQIHRQEYLDGFEPSVIMHVVPFVREFFATMTNRMGLAPFSMPLVRLSDLDGAGGDRVSVSSVEPK